MKSSEYSKEPEIIGQAYQELRSLVRKYSQGKLPVLFIGESGSGKEIFTRFYMASSEIRGIKRIVNCAAFSDELLRSEIFGHVKGAYTGAFADRSGQLDTCKGGILCLDELGDASPAFQAAILRVSEGYSYSPLGSDKEFFSNAVIIASTNKPSQIRPELKNRFHIIPIPPLQKADIPELAKHFLGGKDLNEEFLNELMARDWPANVRELKIYCERQLVENQALFAKGRKSGTIVSYQSFDYHRYRQEFETWNGYIQPILDNHKINGFKYTYQEWKDEWDVHKNDMNKQLRFLSLVRNLCRSFWRILPHSENLYSRGMINLINLISKGVNKESNDLFGDHWFLWPLKPQGIIPRFRHLLRKILELKSLPYLLMQIQTRFRPESIQPSKPSLRFLLDVVPAKEASNQFEKIYCDYHVSLHGSVKATAIAVGLRKNTLRSKLQRIKKKLAKRQDSF